MSKHQVLGSGSGKSISSLISSPKCSSLWNVIGVDRTSRPSSMFRSCAAAVKFVEVTSASWPSITMSRKPSVRQSHQNGPKALIPDSDKTIRRGSEDLARSYGGRSRDLGGLGGRERAASMSPPNPAPLLRSRQPDTERMTSATSAFRCSKRSNSSFAPGPE